MKLESCLNIAKEYLGMQYYSSLNITFKESEDFSVLKVSRNNEKAIIEYGQLVSLFRGLTLLKEKHQEKQFVYSLKAKFKTNGLMLDCSRNGVLRKEKVKEMILINALMGNNRLLLYTEDTFKMDKYPYFGYLRGGYSKEDIKEFVEYGESFGVELIPCIQTLGHMYQALKWLPMHKLKDGKDTLLVDNPKTYEFIEDMIKFSRECFKSKDIHIGMDESFEMGLHRHLALYGYQDRVEMFSRHLLRVKEICEKYDFTPMIWSDMYFRLNNEKEEYYSNNPLPESTLKIIPEGVKLVYWDYYHLDEKDYLTMIKFHKQTNNGIVFAGGSWRWKGYTPSITQSIEYTKSALEACIKENIEEVFITVWGDDGNECSFFTSLPVLAELSVMNYDDFDIKEIDSLFKAISGNDLEDFYLMDSLDFTNENGIVIYYNPSKYLLYQDVLLGIFDSHVKSDFPQKYAQFAAILKEKAQKSPRYGYIFENLSNLSNVLAVKCDLGIRLRKAYKENDKKKLQELLSDFDVLLKRLEVFRKSNEKQWMIECRPFGYEVLDGRLGFLKNRIITAQARVVDYLNGNIKQIEELEEDTLPFDGRDDDVCWNYWYRIVSPSN